MKDYKFLTKENEFLINGNQIIPRLKSFEMYKKYFSTCNTTILWEGLLRLQSTVTLKTDLEFFFNNKDFAGAQSILDFGCGPGDTIEFLNNYFPNKYYTGVDLSADYIQFANEKYGHFKNIKFVCDNIYNFQGAKFDCVILRLVIQHLADIESLFKQLKSLLTKNGTIIIIDSDDTLKKFSVSTPILERMYENLQTNQSVKGGSRQVIHHIGKDSNNFGYMEIDSQSKAVVSFTSSEKENLMQMFCHASEIIKRKFKVEVDQEALYQELNNWRMAMHSYAQVGMKYVIIKECQ